MPDLPLIACLFCDVHMQYRSSLPVAVLAARHLGWEQIETTALDDNTYWMICPDHD